MKISGLEQRIKDIKKKYGDVEISFGYTTESDLMMCNCDVEIEFDERSNELNITAF